MADASPIRSRGRHADVDARPSTGRATVTTTTPRWVKAFAWVTLALVLVFAALHLTGHGFGGHGHHEMHPRGSAE